MHFAGNVAECDTDQWLTGMHAAARVFVIKGAPGSETTIDEKS
jgi:hypothetical protein